MKHLKLRKRGELSVQEDKNKTSNNINVTLNIDSTAFYLSTTRKILIKKKLPYNSINAVSPMNAWDGILDNRFL